MSNVQVFAISINILCVISWSIALALNFWQYKIKILNGEKPDLFDFIVFGTLVPVLCAFVSIFYIVKESIFYIVEMLQFIIG